MSVIHPPVCLVNISYQSGEVLDTASILVLNRSWVMWLADLGYVTHRYGLCGLQTWVIWLTDFDYVACRLGLCDSQIWVMRLADIGYVACRLGLCGSQTWVSGSQTWVMWIGNLGYAGCRLWMKLKKNPHRCIASLKTPLSWTTLARLSLLLEAAVGEMGQSWPATTRWAWKLLIFSCKVFEYFIVSRSWL